MSKKIAIVSGASRGLGKEIALGLSQQHYIVIISYVKNADSAQDLVKQITDSGGQALAVKADVGHYQEVAALFEQVKSQFGCIDVVINTAGISILKPLQDFSPAEFETVLSTNLTGTFNILNQAAQHIAQGGRILTFSSNVVSSIPVNYGPYAASKAAVEVLSKAFSKELRGKEITVNIISPGPTATDMFLEGKTPEMIESFAQLSPFGRLGTPTDIMNVVSFLLTKEASWINGQVIKINGGAN